MNTLWRLATGHPQLLVAHATGYLALLQDDDGRSARQVVRALLGLLLAIAAFAVAAVLAGVALLLAFSPSGGPPLWALLVVPLVPAAIGLVAMWSVQRLDPLPLWAALRQQWSADRAMLRRWEP